MRRATPELAYPAADRLSAEAKRLFGAVDGAFFNAGVGASAALSHITPELYRSQYDLLVAGPLFGAQALAPIMRDGGATWSPELPAWPLPTCLTPRLRRVSSRLPWVLFPGQQRPALRAFRHPDPSRIARQALCVGSKRPVVLPCSRTWR